MMISIHREEGIYLESRKANFDLLRIVSTIAVICIHVAGKYVDAIASGDWLGAPYTGNMMFNCIFNVTSRFAVPCFIMLSGAFTLSNNKNGNFRFYYRKVFRHVGIPTLLFGLLYFIYSMARQIAFIAVGGADWSSLGDILLDAVRGEPFYHMWYLYMMITVYLLVPILIRLKQDIGEAAFKKAGIVFFIAAMLCLWTSSHMFRWDIGYAFCFMGYFIMGYILRTSVKKEKSLSALLLIIAGLLCFALTGYLRHLLALKNINEADLPLSLLNQGAPLSAIGTVLLFAGFAQLPLRGNLTKLSALTFEIYLFHAGIWDVLSRFVTIKMDSRLVIPIMVLAVFLLSLLAAVLWRKIWNAIEKKWQISDRLCRLVHLNG